MVLADLDGYEFQRFVANLFAKLGFHDVKMGPLSADGGIDITMEEKGTVGKIRYIVECKHHPESVIGRPVVQKLHSAVLYSPYTDKGLIVTTGHFSGHAIKYAEEVGITLVDMKSLADLAKKANISLQSVPLMSVDDCFPISSKDIAIKKLQHCLRMDVTGLSDDMIIMDNVFLRLHPSYMIDYSVNSTFSTSVGIIHRVNEKSTVFLCGESAVRIDPAITTPLISMRNEIQSMDEKKLTGIDLNKKEFIKSFGDIKKSAIDITRDLHSKLVSYVGGNNVSYRKQCVPKKKDIEITNIKRAYLPVWFFSTSVLSKKYGIGFVEGRLSSNIVPNMWIEGIPSYPKLCMMCSKPFQAGKYVCSICGSIVCRKDISQCKLCGKHVCEDHTFTKRKFLILSEKYCSSCASSEGILN